MKDKFAQIESRLQKIIEGQTSRLFGVADAEQLMVASLLDALESELRVDENGVPNAPSIFILNVPTDFAADVRSNQPFLDKLATAMTEAGQEAGINIPNAIHINVFPNEEIQAGDFEIMASWHDAPLAETTEIEDEAPLEPKPNIPEKAFLIVGGSKIFALEREVINIGRKLDNHLVLDDPRISRRHSQVRAIGGRYYLFDLESSGGSFLNGERVTQAALHPGDVISLAGVPIVYGQDAVRAISETQEYELPLGHKDANTTASTHLEDLDLDTFTE